MTSAPYHPASNVFVELAVETLKHGLKKVTDGTLSSQVATVLCLYHITPQTMTVLSPSVLLIGKRLRTRLDLVKPNLTSRVESKQLEQEYHDASARSRQFDVREKVYVRNFS